MTFSFENERLTAVSNDGAAMGFILCPRIRPDLVNISQIVTYPQFRGQNVSESMMAALFSHLSERHQRAVLTAPFAQQYMAQNPRWRHLLPGDLHCVTH